MNLAIPRVLPIKPNNFRRSIKIVILIYKLPSTYRCFPNLFYWAVIDTVRGSAACSVLTPNFLHLTRPPCNKVQNLLSLSIKIRFQCALSF